MHWKIPSSQKTTKSSIKAIMILVFYIEGVILVNWVPEGQTVYQIYYKEILIALCVSMVGKRYEMKYVRIGMNSLERYCDSTQHTGLSRYFWKTEFPCWNIHCANLTFLFPKIKSSLKEI